jgi:hypothetical protein
VLDDIMIRIFILVHLDLEREFLCQSEGYFDLILFLQLGC